MNKIILGVALSASLLSGIASATVEEFIKAGFSMDHVVAHGLVEGLSIEETVTRAIAAAPEKADAIIAAAIAAEPSKAQEIVNAAVLSGVDPEQAVAAAVAAGADAGTVSAPTAAGASSLATTSSPTGPGTLPSAPPVPTGSGGGGGGVAASEN